jgi:hypothetical protein
VKQTGGELWAVELYGIYFNATIQYSCNGAKHTYKDILVNLVYKVVSQVFFVNDVVFGVELELTVDGLHGC